MKKTQTKSQIQTRTEKTSVCTNCSEHFSKTWGERQYNDGDSTTCNTCSSSLKIVEKTTTVEAVSIPPRQTTFITVKPQNAIDSDVKRVSFCEPCGKLAHYMPCDDGRKRVVDYDPTNDGRCKICTEQLDSFEVRTSVSTRTT